MNNMMVYMNYIFKSKPLLADALFILNGTLNRNLNHEHVGIHDIYIYIYYHIVDRNGGWLRVGLP